MENKRVVTSTSHLDLTSASHLLYSKDAVKIQRVGGMKSGNNVFRISSIFLTVYSSSDTIKNDTVCTKVSEVTTTTYLNK